jgi:hypothetical protein
MENVNCIYCMQRQVAGFADCGSKAGFLIRSRSDNHYTATPGLFVQGDPLHVAHSEFRL